MTEKELISKIQTLRQVEPEKDWVLSAKTQILGSPSQVLFFKIGEGKLVFASFLVLALGMGLVFVQNALPGDWLYSVKKLSEEGQQVFVAEEQRPRSQLERANRRLEELTRIAQANQVKRLAPAIEELEASVDRAAKGLTEAKELDVKEIVQVAKRLEENKKQIKALGVVAPTEELDQALASLVQAEIEDLAGRSLNERQEEIFARAQEEFEKGNYSEALEMILILSYPQE